MRLSVLSFGLCFLGLSACALAPPGYKYHHDEFPSQKGEDAYDVGYEYTPLINAKALELWDGIAASLLDELETIRPQMSKVVYMPVHPKADANPFVNSYDFALRHQMHKRGYAIAEEKGGMIHLNYGVRPAADRQGLPDVKGAEAMELTLWNSGGTRHVKQVHLLPKEYGRLSLVPNYSRHVARYYHNEGRPDYSLEQRWKRFWQSVLKDTSKPQAKAQHKAVTPPARDEYSPYPPAGYKRSTE